MDTLARSGEDTQLARSIAGGGHPQRRDMPEKGSVEHSAPPDLEVSTSRQGYSVEVSTSRQGYNVEFSTALRGYDKDEVDTFLRELAEEQDRLITQLTAARRRAEKAHLELGEEMGELLQHAKDIAENVVKKAGEEAAVAMEKARRNAEATVAGARRRAEDLNQAAETATVTRVRDAQQQVTVLQKMEAEVRARLASLQQTVRALDVDIERAAQQAPVSQEVLSDGAEVALLTPPPG